MKKFRLLLSLVLGVSLAIATGMTALADVIWEPNDAFYQNAYEDCEYHGRSYAAEGADGTVTVWLEPGSKKTVAQVSNGSEFFVSFTYKDKNDEDWGVVQFTVDTSGTAFPDYMNEGQTGWVPMADLVLIYDGVAFAQDHQGEFKPYIGDYSELTGQEIALWSYPGSGIVKHRTEVDEKLHIFDTYTDDDGRLWGFIHYYYAIKDEWVCLSDPTGATLEVTVTPTGGDEQTPQNSQTPGDPQNQTSMLLVIAAIVVAVVVVTGVIIAVFWKKSSKTDTVQK